MKIQLIKILLVTIIPFISRSFATAECSVMPKDPIDTELERCIRESNGETGAMNVCANQAYEKWDKELNKLYQQIINNKRFKKLSNTKKAVDIKKIIEAQKSWISFRDMDTKAFNEILNPLEGSMWLNVRDGHSLNILKRRVEDLRGYLSYIEEYEDNFPLK